jgi:hypothetical protein
MHDSGIQALQADPGVDARAAVPFKFELSWRSLTQPEVFTAGSGHTSTARSVLSTSADGALWGTVLPFVWQPDAPASPSFAISADQSPVRNWIALGAIGFLVLTLGVAAVRRMQHPSSPLAETPRATVEMGEAGWLTEWVTDPTGSSHGRQISLYRPSLPMSDYRLEFSGRIEQKSLGWAFRKADSRNYYVAKLQATRPGGPVNLVRYGVIRGVEDPHIQIPVPNVSSAGMLKVRLDANRSRFTIYVQNQVVADWEDHRLQKGGVGFLSEREERGQVQSVQISF